jgi:hypothetical protein
MQGFYHIYLVMEPRLPCYILENLEFIAVLGTVGTYACSLV